MNKAKHDKLNKNAVHDSKLQRFTSSRLIGSSVHRAHDFPIAMAKSPRVLAALALLLGLRSVSFLGSTGARPRPVQHRERVALKAEDGGELSAYDQLDIIRFMEKA